MVVSHNIQAMNTNRIANTNFNLYGKSLEKVSSGYKINRAGDDPVGLAMSETMRRQVRGLKQGIENTKAAINFCQVADGALNEVTEMMQRLNKLSVQAETATNSLTDREEIQAEVRQLLAEIDRVADTTTFNEIPIFRGTEEVVVPGEDGSIIEGDIPFEDFSIADVELGGSPFEEDSRGNILKLQAVVKNENSVAHGNTYDLIYGEGSGTYASFRLTYQNNDGSTCTRIVSLSSLTTKPNSYDDGVDSNGYSWWKRSFLYTNQDGVNIEITQKVTAVNPADPTQEKKYNISYSFANANSSKDVTLDFMFNADTAYDNNDTGENYYVNDGSGNGSRLDKWSIYTNGDSWSGSDPIVQPGTANEYIKPNLPNSFSIINADEALAFSERISFVPGSEPNAVSIGPHGDTASWQNYNNLDNSSNLGPIGRPEYCDKAFSLFWNQSINSGGTSEISFNYGIISYRDDNNLSNVTINKNPNVIGPQRPHYEAKNLWIQVGCEKGSGLWLEVDEMNTEVLGIDKLDLTTIGGAAKANIQIKAALEKLAVSRGKIGAQQNRLEHTVANEDNVTEKVGEAESYIRDTDLSSEMIQYSNLSVLLQMGQTMISHVNQQIDKIMTVLR